MLSADRNAKEEISRFPFEIGHLSLKKNRSVESSAFSWWGIYALCDDDK
jgi:hypothetical protein